jgi:hypothetical protein
MGAANGAASVPTEPNSKCAASVLLSSGSSQEITTASPAAATCPVSTLSEPEGCGGSVRNGPPGARTYPLPPISSARPSAPTNRAVGNVYLAPTCTGELQSAGAPAGTAASPTAASQSPLRSERVSLDQQATSARHQPSMRTLLARGA